MIAGDLELYLAIATTIISTAKKKMTCDLFIFGYSRIESFHIQRLSPAATMRATTLTLMGT